MLAVLSVFICCPLTGMLAALLTLRAENSFYKQKYMVAQKEALVARVCLLLSYIVGVVLYIIFIALYRTFLS